MTKPKATQSLVKVSINSPQSMATFANTLKQFIVSKELFTNIKGKNYVNVEGWEFAGASMGIYPIVVEVINQSSDGEIKYSATVELQNPSNGKVYGRGMAVCTNKESSKKNFDEYAIASMAQTRAIGKAYRNAFGWLMKMAGYQPTPAEEAIYETPIPEPEVELPIEKVIEAVQDRLDTLSSADRIRTLKTTGHTSTSKLTDLNWRTLYTDLGLDK